MPAMAEGLRLEYLGTPTAEQAHVLEVLRKRRNEYAYAC